MDTVKENRPDWADLIGQIDPAELVAGVRGILALASAFNALRDEESALSIVLRRLGLLADAAYLPDGGTANVAALQLLMGCSDDTVRRAVNRTGVRKHEPTGRGSSMYRPGDIALSGVFGEPTPEPAERRTGVAPGKTKTPPTPKNRAGGE